MLQWKIIRMSAQKEGPKNLQFLPRRWDGGVSRFAGGAARVFVRLGFRADVLTVLSLAAGAAAGALFGLDRPFLASAAILVCGIFDGLDGKVAALRGTTSAFGAILDSTLDRYAEVFIFIGLAVHFRRSWALWLTLAALVGAFMVSYTRARAEGLGFECRRGLLQRPERFLLVGLSALAGGMFPVFDPVMIGALGTIAVFSNITAVQRAVLVRKAERAARDREGRDHG
jgi:CDP-diacylglycerol--glycerol-3-phosphate 3-phosphatidyltransferase